MVASDIGFHHTDGGQVFLNDAVYHVDGALHHAVQGAHTADNEKQQSSQHRGSHQKYHGQLRIDVKGGSHGGEHHDRGSESGPHACGDGVLYGGYVAGKTGHQGGAAEMVCVGKGKLLQLCKLRLADFGPQSLAATGREHGGALAQHKGDKGKENHLQPFHQDIAPVSIDHAHIHNGSHDQGDDELKHGFGFNTEDGHDGIPFVGLQIR